jgi:hypothetical protein
MTVWLVPEAGGAFKVPYIAYYLGRVTVSDHPGGDISGNHTSSADDTMLPDNYPGKYGTVDAYLSPLINTGSPHTLVSVRTAGMNIIGEGYSGCQENIVLNKSELGHVDFVVDLDIIAYSTTVVDDGIVPDTESISDVVPLSDNHIMSCLQIAADTAAAIDNRAATDASSGADAQNVVRATGRRIVQKHPFINDGTLPQVYRLMIGIQSHWRLHLVFHKSSSQIVVALAA